MEEERKNCLCDFALEYDSQTSSLVELHTKCCEEMRCCIID
jgi:hypothetical protein